MDEAKKSAHDLEEWIASAPAMLRETFEFLKANKVHYRMAFLLAWNSCAEDDRGAIKTRDDFARFMGVCRQVTYQWINRFGRVEYKCWLEDIHRMRMLGSRMAQVDQCTYEAAVSPAGKAVDRELFYKRAGVWKDNGRVELVGDAAQPIRVIEVGSAVTRDDDAGSTGDGPER